MKILYYKWNHFTDYVVLNKSLALFLVPTIKILANKFLKMLSTNKSPKAQKHQMEFQDNEISHKKENLFLYTYERNSFARNEFLKICRCLVSVGHQRRLSITMPVIYHKWSPLTDYGVRNKSLALFLLPTSKILTNEFLEI